MKLYSKALWYSCLGSLLLLLFANNIAIAQDEKEEPKFDAASIEFFETKIRPLLAKRCFECHGPDAKEIEGELHIVSRSALLEGGETGPAIVPGNPKESLLIDSINYGDYEMPPESKLPQAEIDLLTKWVEMGAPWPGGESVKIAKTKFDIEKRKAEHWVWKPPAKTTAPQVKNQAWVRDSLDAFILRKLEQAGIAPQSGDEPTIVVAPGLL